MAVEEGKLPQKPVQHGAPFEFTVQGSDFAQVYFQIQEQLNHFVQGAKMVKLINYEINTMKPTTTITADDAIVNTLWEVDVRGVVYFVDVT